MKKYFGWLVLAAAVSTVGVAANGFFNHNLPLNVCLQGALSAGTGWVVVLILYSIFAVVWDKAAAKDKANGKKPGSLRK